MRRRAAAATAFPIVGVGASAGGLEAFTELLTHLPPDTGMGFVLVQHLDPQHESALPQLLARATTMPVRQVTQNLCVQPDCVYTIPPNATLCIDRGVLKLQPRRATRTPHRSVDYFLESLAQDQHELAIGVILSGTANDGTLGLEAIKAEGGITFAQDDSARYDSMPRSAVAAGCVDFVLSPQAIAFELARIARRPYVAGSVMELPIERPTTASLRQAENERVEASAHQDDASALPSGGSGKQRSGANQARAEAESAGVDRNGDTGFRKILLLLRTHSGVDFSLYKSPTIQRRVARRLVLNKHDTLAGYADFLRGNNAEVEALYSDVLVSVTSFFRNPEAFDVLQQKIFPRLLESTGNEPVRMWTLGCSTGQEAYSLAMAFTECAGSAPPGRKLQLFATDLNAALVEKARHGLYAKTIADDLSPERLRRFFVEEEGGYRVVKSLRESVVFARQNLIDDPPFSRMDLISCRNLLIYLGPSLQKKALPTFHYALKPEGYLFLGASESVGGFTDLFESADKKQKIYCKKLAPPSGSHLPIRKSTPDPRPTGDRTAAPFVRQTRPRVGAPEGFNGEPDAQREADRVILSQYAPPSVLVNASLQVLQFRGATDPYLSPASGKATFDLLKMVRDGLMLPLRAAISKAGKVNEIVRKQDLGFEYGGIARRVNLEVVPLKNLRERCFLVIFDDADRSARTNSGAGANVPATTGKRSRALGHELRQLLNERETELSDTRDYLQSVQEQYEAANEELQSASEEVQSANEELQSLNEELETSKEELESSNEELTTVNEEMANRNIELNRVNSDLVNLQSAAKLVIVQLGRDLTIRRFSAQAEKHFELLPADLGRPIGNLRHNLKIANLEGLIADVIDSVRESEREVMDEGGRWWSLRIRPYLDLDNKVDGAVLVLVDIDVQRRGTQAIAETRDYAEAVVRSVRNPLLVLNADLRVHQASAAFYRDFKLDPAQVEGRSVYELGNRSWDVPELRRLLEIVLPTNSVFENLEISQVFEAVGRRNLLLNARRLDDSIGQPARILLGIEDVTERERGREALKAAERKHRRVLDSVPQKLFTATRDGEIDYVNPAWIKYTGRPFEQLKGSGWTDVVHPDDLPENLRVWQCAVSAAEPFMFAHRLRHADGEYRWHLIHAEPVLDETGAVSMWAGSNNDLHEVTEAKHRKDQFLAMLAHELRGPLAPLSNALQIMRREDAKAGVVQRAGDLALKQMQHMSRLIDDLLNLSRINSGRLELRRMPVDVIAAARDAVDSARPAIAEAGHALTLELPHEPLYVDGDPVRLAQMFSNLVNNACKYTDPPGRIHLKVENRDGGARISVSDNGVGIAADMLTRIFDMFIQVDQSLARGKGGLGIGLSLVRSLVELHGGQVQAYSKGVGQGAEFVVTLPELADPVPPRASPHTPPTTVSSGGHRILVVDDNRDTALSFSLLLQLEGHRTAIAHDGTEALAIGDRFYPHVVLLDIGLSGQSGYEVAEQIRKRSWGGKLLLIAVTGWGQESDREKSRQAGFDHHLVKPVDHAVLDRLLAQFASDAADPS